MMVYEYMPGCPQTIEDNRQIGLCPPVYVVASSGARPVCVLTRAHGGAGVGGKLAGGAVCTPQCSEHVHTHTSNSVSETTNIGQWMMDYKFMSGCPQMIEDSREIGLCPPLYVVASSGARRVCVLTRARSAVAGGGLARGAGCTPQCSEHVHTRTTQC